jgi:hypothetical protein
MVPEDRQGFVSNDTRKVAETERRDNGKLRFRTP